MNYVFFYIGLDVEQPEMAARSIKAIDPNSKIIQLTDYSTPECKNADECIRYELDKDKLMLSKLKAYAEYPVDEPTVYIDTDMIAVKSMQSFKPLKSITVCKRSFDKRALINEDHISKFNYESKRVGQFDINSLINKRIDEVMPYLACFTVVNNNEFWSKCLNYLMTLDRSFHIWYGDQLAIKQVVETYPQNDICEIQESASSCPSYAYEKSSEAFFIHFKGELGKQVMKRFVQKYYV